jgi:hypothetical protein
MADWILYTTIGCAALIALLLAVLILRGKIELGDIEIGWPPKITFKSKSGASSSPAGGADVIGAEGKSKIGKVNIEGAAPNFSASAKEESEIGDITVKRKM